MTIERRVVKTGGSLSVIIPRDIAAMINLEEGSAVRMSVVRRSLVIEPSDETASDEVFRRAFATVLRRYDKAFAGLAAYDNGTAERPQRKAAGRRAAR